jgi:soluble lytic murein transglycosylase-like protein
MRHKADLDQQVSDLADRPGAAGPVPLRLLVRLDGDTRQRLYQRLAQNALGDTVEPAAPSDESANESPLQLAKAGDPSPAAPAPRPGQPSAQPPKRGAVPPEQIAYPSAKDSAAIAADLERTKKEIDRRQKEIDRRQSVWDQIIHAPLPEINATSQKPLPDDWEGTINKIDPRYGAWTREAAQRNGIPPELLARLFFKESNHDKNKASRRGAKGLAQLTPGAVQAVGLDPSKFGYFDPKSSIDAGAAYLAQQFNRFRDWPKASAAYNAGAGNIDGWLSGFNKPEPSQETKAYLKYIFRGDPNYFDNAR